MFIQKSLILNPWGRDYKIPYKPTNRGWYGSLLHDLLRSFGRPRLAATSARTGAEKDAAGVAAPGDTKVSDAMA